MSLSLETKDKIFVLDIKILVAALGKNYLLEKRNVRYFLELKVGNKINYFFYVKNKIEGAFLAKMWV